MKTPRSNTARLADMAIRCLTIDLCVRFVACCMILRWMCEYCECCWVRIRARSECCVRRICACGEQSLEKFLFGIFLCCMIFFAICWNYWDRVRAGYECCVRWVCADGKRFWPWKHTWPNGSSGCADEYWDSELATYATSFTGRYGTVAP